MDSQEDRTPSDDVLDCAWALRQHVLPALASAGDLVSVGLATPLLSRAALSLASGRCNKDPPALLWRLCDALVSACARSQAPEAARIASEPFAVGRRAAELARGPRGESTYRAVQSICVRSALHSGSPAVAEVLSGPLLQFPASPQAVPDASLLELACRAGLVRTVSAVLPQPPFCLGSPHASHSDAAALRAACSAGHADVVRALAGHPFYLGREHAACLSASALRSACEKGHTAVIDVLASPPYMLGSCEARCAQQSALWSACLGGHVDTVARLSREPYCLGRCDARAFGNRLLRAVCLKGLADVVKLLSIPPYSLTASDATTYPGEPLDSFVKTPEVMEVLAPLCPATERE
eukprot:m51a1_g10956 hypothetical protein (353) ;mRNA; f:207845-208903